MTDENGENTDKMPTPKSVDQFIASMSFASGTLQRRDCDLEELPPPIRNAVKQYKRQRLDNMPLRRSQVRTLVRRHGNVSIYKFTMPMDAEPLVDFGNSHRLVWIEKLGKSSHLVSIGKGILGSRDEEQSRTKLDWQEGRAYFLKSNGGKAVGWIHKYVDNENEDSRREGVANKHAIIYICKVLLDQRSPNKGPENEETQQWNDTVSRLVDLELKNEAGKDQLTNAISVESSDEIKKIFDLFHTDCAQVDK